MEGLDDTTNDSEDESSSSIDNMDDGTFALYPAYVVYNFLMELSLVQPEPESKKAKPKNYVKEFVLNLRNLINKAYQVGEKGMWKEEDHKMTDYIELFEFIRQD